LELVFHDKIYTRTGDDGSTGLLGAERVQKDSLRIEALGALGECNAALGLAHSDMPEEDLDKILESLMGAIWSDSRHFVRYGRYSMAPTTVRTCCVGGD
jgi:ATP:cob(I)alamin adenosyltransferase